MIEVKEDEVILSDENGKFLLAALGGPGDEINITGHGYVNLSPEEWNQLQLALLNFNNTGFFDEEA